MMKSEQLKNNQDIKLLLVEDNPADARLVQEMLGEVLNLHQIRLTKVENLEDTLSLLNRESFDVLLLDLNLPDAQGLHGLHQIQCASPSLPIVVLSGHQDEELALKAVKSGAQDYLVKGQGDGNLLTRSLFYSIERKYSETRLAYLAQYDPLTDLPNRTLFRDRLNRALQHSSRSNGLTALIFLDLDHFKDINDTLGHNAGDVLLVMVAERLKQCVRAEDTIARLGGDEFTIILSDLDHRGEAANVAQKILDAMSNSFSLNGSEVFVTTSLGIATYPSCGEDEETLIKNADTALYAAKDKGRSNYQFYEDEMNAIVSERMTMINNLRMAVQQGEFSLHYQPQINAKTHGVIRTEALLRWTNPELGVVPPEKFIPLLEETGLIVAVGEWVLRKACQQNLIWIKAGLPPLPISVNISARQLRQKQLANTVAGILEEVGLESQYLQIEITESALIENTDASFTTLEALHEIGVRIAIDDFGSGYSSLSYLKEFPLDILKLDNSFIKGISTSSDDAAIVEAIIGLGHSLRLKVVAEGVETEEQLSFLRDRGCDELQGYIFSTPLNSVDCEKWLRMEMSKIATHAAH